MARATLEMTIGMKGMAKVRMMPTGSVGKEKKQTK
jgi:hypothetical protein